MSEEEKKAIEMCRLLLNGDITLHIIDDDGGTAYAGAVNKTYNDDLEKVLNLIEKQDKEIETYKKIANYMAGWLKFFSNSEKSEKELLEWAEKAVENVVVEKR